jgi:hypothetical protein
MHCERSEDARNVIEDQNLDVQTKYTRVVSVIKQGVLDGTPKHKDAKESRCNECTRKKSRKSAAFWDEESNRLIGERKAALIKLR